MIGVDTAIAEFKIKEYWINVYMIEDKQELGWKYTKKDKATKKAAYVLQAFGTKCLYRIHVRMK